MSDVVECKEEEEEEKEKKRPRRILQTTLDLHCPHCNTDCHLWYTIKLSGQGVHFCYYYDGCLSDQSDEDETICTSTEELDKQINKGYVIKWRSSALQQGDIIVPPRIKEKIYRVLQKRRTGEYKSNY